jgi:hypothetical protein
VILKEIKRGDGQKDIKGRAGGETGMPSSRAPGRTVAPSPFNFIVAVFSLPYKNASFCVHREKSSRRGSEVIPEVWGFVSRFWRLEFEGGFYVLGKSA